MGNSNWKTEKNSFLITPREPQRKWLTGTYPPYSPVLGIGTHPKCVHTPIRIRNSGFFARWESVCGSRKSDKLTVFACETRRLWMQAAPRTELCSFSTLTFIHILPERSEGRLHFQLKLPNLCLSVWLSFHRLQILRNVAPFHPVHNFT